MLHFSQVNQADQPIFLLQPKERNRAKESSSGQTVLSMMGILKATTSTDAEPTRGRMDASTQAIGSTTRWTDMESSNGQVNDLYVD